MVMLAGLQVHVSESPLHDESEVVQAIVDAYYGHQAEWIAFTPEQLGDEFFELRTGRAGAITQKFVNYKMGLAVVGDIAERVARSTPLADWVRESNRGHNLLFAADLDQLAELLQHRQ
ncbi:DUF4180 domain-containing protein [Kribbella solani]|uniref:DUF4180 domain-containing protein n=1 Tax=Kribbella solani TaxID=236067 RepID=A0A841DQT6_9ACTN|nr:DUF4180 domain-containing protein [Kribbella solani]MBB5979060.1 hypothetical protein [Kribbella solani]MDX2970633.1 DUF4180 domain-containing protein [Kribbella solani]MDX3000223.1 DUF4180 domain-containing protein [Kribbella solani]